MPDPKRDTACPDGIYKALSAGQMGNWRNSSVLHVKKANSAVLFIGSRKNPPICLAVLFGLTLSSKLPDLSFLLRSPSNCLGDMCPIRCLTSPYLVATSAGVKTWAAYIITCANSTSGQAVDNGRSILVKFSKVSEGRRIGLHFICKEFIQITVATFHRYIKLIEVQ